MTRIPRWVAAATLGLVILVLLVLVDRAEATWAAAVATLALVAATLILGLHTQTLSSQTEVLASATKELAAIGERQDLRGRLEKAIAAGQTVLAIDVDSFVAEARKGRVFRGPAECVLDLAKYADLLSDGDTRKGLTQWRNWVDDHVHRTVPWGTGDEGVQMKSEYRNLQSRLEDEVRKWRDRLVSL